MKSVPPEPLGEDLRAHWMLADGVTFLNHGSFGAVPREIYALADNWRRQIEAEPIEIMGRRWSQIVADSKRPVADFLNARPEHLGFVTNATEGVMSVLHSLELQPGEELVTTNHVYHAVRQAMKFTAKRWKADYREISIQLPVDSSDQIAERVIAGLSSRTRLLVIDHVTSPTALVFPIERIAVACKERGVELLVDGAHGPGMVPLNLESLGRIGVTCYAGNLHKWCCAPKGAAFLWAQADYAIHPAVISHWYGEGMSAEFHWQGTRDHAGWLCAGDAIDWLGKFGWDDVRAYNHALATWSQEMLCERFGVPPISPIDGSLLGSMTTVQLPSQWQGMDEAQLKIMQQRLYDKLRIEAPLLRWGGANFFRVACQIYNTADEVKKLADAIEKLI
jgi:isopenicillin-N epimerase